MWKMNKGLNIGIDVVIGEKISPKSIFNANDMPKIYTSINPLKYEIAQTNLNTNYSTQNNSFYNTNNTATYSNALISDSYLRTDTHKNPKAEFTPTKISMPEFNSTPSYKNISCSYCNK